MPGIQKIFIKGEHIIAEGSEGKSLYIIRSGRVEVYKQAKGKNVRLATLGPDEVFGEMSLIDNRYSKRTASVRALEDTKVVILDRKAFDEYMEQIPPGVYNLIQRLSNRLRATDELIAKAGAELESLPAVLKTEINDVEDRKLTDDQVAESLDAAVDLNLIPRKFKKGQVLIKEGAEAMSVFLLKQGSVSITKKIGETEVEIGSLGSSDTFGEISMFESDGKRFSTVTALEDGETVVFGKKDMNEMFRKSPLEMMLIMECLCQKLKHSVVKYLDTTIESRKLEGRIKDLQDQLKQQQEQLKSLQKDQDEAAGENDSQQNDENAAP